MGILTKKYSFYFEAVKLLKRHFSDANDKCPIPDYGVDQSILYNL